MRPRTQMALGAAAALAMMVVPCTSDAGDHKIFPGSFCQQSLYGANHLNYSLNGGTLSMEAPNNGAAGGEVSCPILRDNEANTNGFKFTAWVYDFWNENGDDELERVVCSVGIRKSDGSGQLDWETRATGVDQTGFVKLDWGTSLATGEAFAVYYMDCFVPTYSRISSYRTDEP
jgi:hypothetical protein